MSKVSLVSRYVLGLIYFVFGLNGFLQFLPQPPLPESAMGFLGGLMSAGYFFPFLKGTEVLMGALLLAGFAVPFALIVLAPITINILLFHTILTPGPQNAVLPVVMVLLSVAAA
ncbi:MAG: acyltransferase, partial [Bdellovibrionaceae bacterium]|nr:acyltransferase [Pseudobdellovibrionaceae bacterium]